jgi:hypothetical protein
MDRVRDAGVLPLRDTESQYSQISSGTTMAEGPPWGETFDRSPQSIVKSRHASLFSLNRSIAMAGNSS